MDAKQIQNIFPAKGLTSGNSDKIDAHGPGIFQYPVNDFTGQILLPGIIAGITTEASEVTPHCRRDDEKEGSGDSVFFMEILSDLAAAENCVDKEIPEQFLSARQAFFPQSTQRIADKGGSPQWILSTLQSHGSIPRFC